MIPWEYAFRIFLLGFSGVFVTLGILVIAILIMGKVVKLLRR